MHCLHMCKTIHLLSPQLTSCFLTIFHFFPVSSLFHSFSQEFLAFLTSEGLRGENQDQERKKYPGGAFDPVGLSKDPKSFEKYKMNEIRNGRLAMLACAGAS